MGKIFDAVAARYHS